MKNLKNVVLLGAGALAVGTVVVQNIQNRSHLKTKTALMALGVAEAFAAEGTEPSDTCFSTFKEVVAGSPSKGTYTNKVLDHGHKQLYRLNNVETADIEMVFCRLEKVLGVDPDLTALPQTTTKTDPLGNTIEVTVSAPEETFATTAGYTAKAVVKSNDTIFLTMWWAGSQDSSKGYLIQGANPMAPDGMTRLRYAQWDREGEEQFVKVFGTQFATSYLGSVSGSSGSKSGGDGAHYGRLDFNTTTKGVDAQSVEIRKGRTNNGCSDTSNAFACIRTALYGTIGGTLSGYRPAVGCLEAVSATATNGTGMDGEGNIADAVATADNLSPVAGSTMTTVFDHSCSYVNGAGGTGQPFAGNTVNFAATPTSIFPQ